MTIIHLALILSLLDHLHRALQALHSMGGNSAAFFLAILPPYSARHQMSVRFPLNCYTLDKHVVFLPCVLLNIHEEMDPPGYVAYIPYRSIFAFHWMHAHYALHHHFHTRNTKG